MYLSSHFVATKPSIISWQLFRFRRLIGDTDYCCSHLWKSSRYVIIFKAMNCVICIAWFWANVCIVTGYDWHVDGRVVLWGFRRWHGGHDVVLALESFRLHSLFVSGISGLPLDKWTLMQIFGGLFVVSLLNKHTSCWWRETPRHSCDVTLVI